MRCRPFLLSALFLLSVNAANPAWAVSRPRAQPDVAIKGPVGPAWLANEGRAALALLDLLETSNVDGLDPAVYRPAELRRALRRGLRGSQKTRAKAAAQFSNVFARYAADVVRPRETSTVYVDPAARPRPVSTQRLIVVAAGAPQFDEFIRSMGWMHPYYGRLRQALQSELEKGGGRVPLLRLNLERARVLPRGPEAAIVVNTAAAQLELFEDREVRDRMRVVVGETAQQTPMMAGLIRYAILNPYWHVPPDLTRKNIAPRVLKEGMKYFRSRGYQVVSEWSRDARVIPETSIDWKAVARGDKEIFVRQLPGPANGMGEVKFMFPNDMGIYLHDTPAKGLFAKEERQFSAGCVRLEDADRLKKLLLGDLQLTRSKKPEQIINLPKPVPVYLTYMTAFPQDGRIVERPDVYGRDRAVLIDQGRSRPSSG
ncbi:L,D-transpeptidase family protein [Sphingomonas edaphi]|uniref:L,D-transpeptidase n=1 Tax=Sphingomonas edaphi TaxID=2315689 RepID=A0A418PZC7_9SPHN|nr:L,D-transpeptidase family protein [Sphingomonas edaphi]RIX27432.1 L,D-transpeptidase [Sphingomonas edaphi]